MRTTITLYIKPKQTQNWNQIEESQETKNPIKIAKTKKREKENLITKISWFFFAIDLTTKGRRRKRGNLQRKKNKKQKKLNLDNP